jgi:tetratricopeptide (TPR) repeat protein
MKYKGTSKSLPDIAQELSVDAILEGSALLLGNRVRISVRLVAARTDETIWSDRYDDSLEDVLDLQSRVAAAVAKKIAIHLTPQEATRLATQRPVNPEAHLEFMRGRHTLEASSPQAVELSLKHFKRALELDPDLAGAWQGIAQCHITRAQRGMAPPAEAMAEAELAARRAMALDPDGAAAHQILGGLRFREMDLLGAILEFQKSIELEPGNAGAYVGLSRACFCAERHAEAETAALKAISLNPLSMIDHTVVGDVYYYARRYEDSLLYYRRAIELDPRFDGAHTDLARSLEAVGRFDEARAEYEEGRRLSGGVAGPNFGLGHLAASSGDVAEARRILDELIAARGSRVVSAWGIAALHASLGDIDQAFRWLDVAVEEKATGLIFLRVHPRIDSLRGDPRFPALMKRVGLDRV